MPTSQIASERRALLFAHNFVVEETSKKWSYRPDLKVTNQFEILAGVFKPSSK